MFEFLGISDDHVKVMNLNKLLTDLNESAKVYMQQMEFKNYENWDIGRNKKIKDIDLKIHSKIHRENTNQLELKEYCISKEADIDKLYNYLSRIDNVYNISPNIYSVTLIEPHKDILTINGQTLIQCCIKLEIQKSPIPLMS